MEKVRTALLLCSSLWVLVAAPGAWAQASHPSDKDLALGHFERGKELYLENDYQGALIEFKRAYQLAPNYKLLYNLGQVDLQLQQWSMALRYFQQYLDEGGSDLSPQRRASVETEIQRLRQRLGTLRVSVDQPGADVFVDDEKVGISPLGRGIPINAGRRKVSASYAGSAPVSRSVEVASGESVDVRLELKDVLSSTRPGAPAQGEPSVAKGATRPGWVPWALTGALAAGGAATGILALRESNALKAERAKFPADQAALSSHSVRTRNLAIATDALLGVAVGSAAVLTYLTLTATDAPPPKLSLGADVVHRGLVLSGSF